MRKAIQFMSDKFAENIKLISKNQHGENIEKENLRKKTRQLATGKNKWRKKSPTQRPNIPQKNKNNFQTKLKYVQ